MQADAYAGFNRLDEAGRKPGPIVEAACWAHARRKFFDLARIKKAPIARRDCPIIPAKRIADLLPWNWRPQNRAAEAA